MSRAPVLGLRANLAQFSLLILVNALVGAMVGLERAALPALAGDAWHVASRAALLAFVASFGAAKAVANLVAGRLADARGRRPVLLAGWALMLPVPVLIAWAPSWWVVVAANLLLGAGQGLAWTTTVLAKLDLAGPRRRGLATGLNEFAGYAAVGLAAWAGWAAAGAFELRRAFLLLGVAIAVLGFALSLAARETSAHAGLEARGHAAPLRGSFARLTLDRRLLSLHQAGLVNNLNDAVVWGLVPVLLLARAPGDAAGLVAAAYPLTWGLAQLATGPASDRVGRAPLVAGGLLLQAAAIASLALAGTLVAWLAAAIALGLGTAMTYPALLAAVADVAHPAERGAALGVYRFWRDGGFVLGAIAGGLLADAAGIEAALLATAAVTAASGAAAWISR